jgi:hypothetical protein
MMKINVHHHLGRISSLILIPRANAKRWPLTLALAATLVFSSTAHSHSLSTSYGELEPRKAKTQMPSLIFNLKLALSDLQLALGWSTQRDLTWTMVKKQQPQILAYLQQQLVLHDQQRQPLACSWQSDAAAWQLTKIQQQYYLQVQLSSHCPSANWLHYQLFMQLHEHKALVQTPQGERILAEATPWLAL